MRYNTFGDAVPATKRDGKDILGIPAATCATKDSAGKIEIKKYSKAANEASCPEYRYQDGQASKSKGFTGGHAIYPSNRGYYQDLDRDSSLTKEKLK